MTIQSPRIARSYVMPDVFQMSLRYLPVILAVSLGFAVAAVAIGAALPPTYQASAKLYIDPRDLKGLDNQVTPTAEAQNIGITLVETQALVLGSDNLKQLVVAKLALAEDPEFNGTPRSFIAKTVAWFKNLGDVILGKDPADTPDPNATAVEKLRKAVEVFRIDRTYVINATARAESGVKAAAILNELLQAFLDDESRARSDAAKRTGDDIDSGLEKLKSDLAEWEAKVARYKEVNNLAGVRGQIVTEQQLADLNTQLITARVDAARLKARLDATPKAARDLDTVPEAVTSPTLQSLRDLLARVSQRRASLETQLRPRHPDLRAIADSEQQILRQIDAALRRISDSLAIDYSRAKANETALSSQLEDLRGLLNKDNTAQIGLRELERKLEAARSVYNQAITRVKETSEQARVNTANVRVISAVRAERNPVFPPALPLLGAVGLLFGALLSVVVLHLRNLIGQRRVG